MEEERTVAREVEVEDRGDANGVADDPEGHLNHLDIFGFLKKT